MASLGTLAAELKLEGAAEMMAGLRGAGGAVSGLGPLAQFGGALRAVRSAGGERLPTFAAPAALVEAGDRLPLPVTPPAQRASGTEAGGGLRAVLTEFRQVGESLRTQLAGRTRPERGGAGLRSGLDGGADVARGLRGVLEQFRAGLRDGRGEARDNGGAIGGASTGGPGIRLDSGAHGLGEGDRLARVGGFIGGSGGPALDYHRRTASATEKSAQNLQTLGQRWSGPNTTAQAAVWA